METMTAGSFSVFILVCLNLILHQCHGFEVIQPQFQTVNPDGSATISCEYTPDNSSIEDVRLNSISQRATRSKLCQKGMRDCRNIVMYSENPNKWLFVLLNVGPEAEDVGYECQYTVGKNDLHYEKRGRTPTRLLARRQETGECCVPPPPDPPQLHRLIWILVGLLAVLFLYGCVLTCLYISLRVKQQRLGFSSRPNSRSVDTDNGTYVEMRTAPARSENFNDVYA